MYIKNIELYNFRTYSKINVNLINGINIFYGKNAQGKTNILESIYVLGLTDTFRDGDKLIKQEFNEASIIGNINIEDINYKLNINLNNNKKELYIDNNKINKISDYISYLKTIIFSPEDVFLIKGSPEKRRKYFNTQISQLNNKYYLVLNKFNKLLKIRNIILKNNLKGEIIDKEYFNIVTTSLINMSIILLVNRDKYIRNINNYISNIYYNLSGINDFKLVYKNNFNINLNQPIDNLFNELKSIYDNNYNLEIKLGKTLLGIQNDEFVFLLNNENIKEFGSQGQQRLAVLALKLAEIEVFKKFTGTKPILLLDDVFSELDKYKKNNILNYIKDDLQIIITTTDLNNLNKRNLKNCKIFYVENSVVEER